MGSLDDESDQTYTGLESEPESTDGANESLSYTALAFDEYSRFASDNRILSFTSCSSSISSDSSLEDPLQDLDNEQDKSSLKLSDNDQLAQLATEPDENNDEQSNDSGSPISSSGPPANDPICEIPPVQAMERAATSKYRIPSHVFERKKSVQGEWSMGSNESLFSIPGNSFCKDSERFNHSQSFGCKTTTKGGKSSKPDKTGKIHEPGKGSNNQGSSIPYEPMIPDSKEDRRSTTDQRTHFSEENSSSTKSFVFPILAGGETDKGNSPNPRGSPTRLPEKPMAESPPNPAPAPESPSNPEASESKAKTKKTTPLKSWNWKKWFPCFRYCSCCTCCS